MAAMVKTAVAAICLFTLLATAYLTASLLILRPPRANYQQWAVVASAIVAQGTVTLIALYASSPKRLRYMTIAGGLALAGLGASAVYSTLSGPHFEGYALVLGSAMVLQGTLTIGLFSGWQKLRMAGLPE
jgi:hypothetical protein